MQNKDKEYFTVVYYETRKKLNISIVEYLILDYLVFLKGQKHKEFTYKMAMDKLHLSKNTFKKYLLSLIKKGFIEPRERKKEMFCIDHNIIEDMSEKRGKFFLIYHDKRKELKLTLTQFGFLSMVYSLSKKNKNQRAFMGKKNYKKYLGIRSDKNYYETINNLINKGLIIKKGVSVFMIPDNVFYFFAEHDYSLKKSFGGGGFKLRNNIDENDLKNKVKNDYSKKENKADLSKETPLSNGRGTGNRVYGRGNGNRVYVRGKGVVYKNTNNPHKFPPKKPLNFNTDDMFKNVVDDLFKDFY